MIGRMFIPESKLLMREIIIHVNKRMQSSVNNFFQNF